MALQIADTFDFLIGDWSIERVISDHRGGADTRFSGTATVRPDEAGDVAVYSEQGQVTSAGHSGPARRTLRFSARPGGTVGVDFPDGRPFLELDLRDGSCRATHPCRADTYALAYEVLASDRIHERWRVTGPAKDYEAETIWSRVAATSA